MPHHSREPITAQPRTITLSVTTYPIFLQNQHYLKVGRRRRKEIEKNPNEQRPLLFLLIKISHPASATWRQVCSSIPPSLSPTGAKTPLCPNPQAKLTHLKSFWTPWKTLQCSICRQGQDYSGVSISLQSSPQRCLHKALDLISSIHLLQFCLLPEVSTLS